jgi:hypothetical protein
MMLGSKKAENKRVAEKSGVGIRYDVPLIPISRLRRVWIIGGQ